MRPLFLFFLILFSSLLSSCLYDAPPSPAASQLDTWLLGKWITQDKRGKIFEAIITPRTNTHYHVVFYDKDKNNAHPWEFDGWIARVGDLKLLTLQSLSTDPRYDHKYLFLHYELIEPEKASPGNVPARRIRINEPQLPSSAQQLDSFHLRQLISKGLQQGTLLPSQETIGFSTWTRVGSISLPEKFK